MADLQLTVQMGTLPPDFCPATEQERADGYAAEMTVEVPGSNTSVIIQQSTPGADDRDKLWVKTDGDGNPQGEFIFSPDVGDWVRATPFGTTVPTGQIIDWYYADTEANAKTASKLLGQENEPNPNPANPYWLFCDGTSGTPDLRGRVMMGAGAGAGLTARTNGQILGEETHLLITAEIPDLPDANGRTLGTGAFGGGLTTGLSAMMDNGTVSPTDPSMIQLPSGGGLAHNNIQPSVCSWKLMKSSRQY